VWAGDTPVSNSKNRIHGSRFGSYHRKSETIAALGRGFVGLAPCTGPYGNNVKRINDVQQPFGIFDDDIVATNQDELMDVRCSGRLSSFILCSLCFLLFREFWLIRSFNLVSASVGVHSRFRILIQGSRRHPQTVIANPRLFDLSIRPELYAGN
jgi:hypothetical protein